MSDTHPNALKAEAAEKRLEATRLNDEANALEDEANAKLAELGELQDGTEEEDAEEDVQTNHRIGRRNR